MKSFYYKDQLYIRLIPSKAMFNSTLVHQVVNRGDVFAMRVLDQQFTIISGKAEVTHVEYSTDLKVTLTSSQAQRSLI